MKNARDVTLEKTVVQRVDVHGAATVVRHVEDVFGGVTRAVTMAPVPETQLASVDAESAAMTSVWVTPLRDPKVTEVISVSPMDARASETKAKLQPSVSRRWWMAAAAAVLVALACAGWLLTRQRAGAGAIRRDVAASVPVVAKHKPRPLPAPISNAERVRQEAEAAAALIAGDRSRALVRYRVLAEQTNDAVFARVVHILEATP